MKVVTCVGARPQFVKAAVLSAEFARRGVDEVVVHTGQHYDASMSAVFFEELAMAKPRYDLGVGSAGHGVQTAAMLAQLEPILADEEPAWMLVYGDTNSTLAGALAAVKLGIPVAHVEAGLRSFDRRMPEEINRVLVDRISDLLLVPNERAVAQLASEGIVDGVCVVGDVMVDLASRVASTLSEHPHVLDRFGVLPYAYGVVTIHRAANTEDERTFARLIAGLRRAEMPLIFPVHPRTRALVEKYGVGDGDNIALADPLSYLEMIALASRARAIFTDSGGLQKEAYALGVLCVTLRDETEWVETLDRGWNVLAGSDPDTIAASARRFLPARRTPHYGGGRAACRIAEALLRNERVELAGKGAG